MLRFFTDLSAAIFGPLALLNELHAARSDAEHYRKHLMLNQEECDRLRRELDLERSERMRLAQDYAAGKVLFAVVSETLDKERSRRIYS